MSRLAVIVAEAFGSLAERAAVEQVLQRFRYTRITHVASVASALETIGDGHADLLAIPIDVIDDEGLAALDRTLRHERHVGIVATSPRQDPELLLRAMRSGIQEFLLRPTSLAELAPALERLHRRAESQEVNGQVYVLFSARSGVGTTTTAVNLAAALAANHADSRVALADLALSAGDACNLLNARPVRDLGELATKLEQLNPDLLSSVMAPAADGVWCLASPDRPNAADAVDAGVVSAIVAQLRASYSFTVIDCEHQLNDRTLAALDGADRILLLTELKVPALRVAQRTLGMFRRLGYASDKLCVVVNRVQSGHDVSSAEAAQALRSDIFFKLPDESGTVAEAAARGEPVVQSHPESRLAWAYLQLAKKLGGGTPGSAGRLRWRPG